MYRVNFFTVLVKVPCDNICWMDKTDGVLQHRLSTAWCELFRHLLVLILLDDLIYGDFQGDIVVAGVTAVLIDPELSSSHRLSIRDLSQIKTELLVVPPLVREILVSLDWGETYFMMNFIFTGSGGLITKYDLISCVLFEKWGKKRPH